MSFRSDFEQARDFLILHRSDYNYAYSHFQWPHVENFNWAIDYFDSMAEDNEAIGLWIVDEKGQQEKYSFDALSKRSIKSQTSCAIMVCKKAIRFFF